MLSSFTHLARQRIARTIRPTKPQPQIDGRVVRLGPLATLPDEIIEIIFEFIRPGHLFKIIQVNKTFHDIGIRVLYRFVYIHHPHREILFHMTLIEQRPEYAKLIKEFRRSAHTDASCHPSKVCQTAGIFVRKVFGTTVHELQCRALALAVNIQSLEISLGPLIPFEDDQVSYTDDPSNDPFAQVRWLVDGKIKLKRLIIHPLQVKQWINIPSYSNKERFLATILRAQPALLHLEAPNLPKEITPQTLPNLHSLAVGDVNHLLAALTNERPLKVIACKSGYLAGLESLVKEVARRQGGQHVLEFAWEGTMWNNTDDTFDFDFMPPLFPNLRVLRLGLRTRNFVQFIKNIYNVLPHCTNLLELDLAGSGQYDCELAQVDSTIKFENGAPLDRMSVVLACHQKCSSLRRITHPDGQSWFRYGSADSWTCASSLEGPRDHWLLRGDGWLPGDRMS